VVGAMQAKCVFVLPHTPCHTEPPPSRTSGIDRLVLASESPDAARGSDNGARLLLAWRRRPHAAAAAAAGVVSGSRALHLAAGRCWLPMCWAACRRMLLVAPTRRRVCVLGGGGGGRMRW
jgi:hypothetical protein